MKAIVLDDSIVLDGNRILFDVEFPESGTKSRLEVPGTATEADMQAAVKAEAARLQAEIDAAAVEGQKNATAKARFAGTVGRELTVDKDKVTVGAKVAAEKPIDG